MEARMKFCDVSSKQLTREFSLVIAESIKVCTIDWWLENSHCCENSLVRKETSCENGCQQYFLVDTRICVAVTSRISLCGWANQNSQKKKNENT